MLISKIGGVLGSLTPCHAVALPRSQFPGFVKAAKKPAESSEGKHVEVFPEPKKRGLLAENVEFVTSKASPSQLMMKLVNRDPSG